MDRKPDIYRLVDPSTPVERAGVRPSSPDGARVFATRLQLHWLQEGVYVPASVVKTVEGVRGQRAPMYGPKLHWDAARKVSPEEAINYRMSLIDGLEQDLWV